MKKSISLPQALQNRNLRKGWSVCAVVFCLFSAAYFSLKNNQEKALFSLLSMLYVFIPSIAQKLFHFQIQTPLYFLVIAYTVAPLLGYAYNFYYTIPWWDDVLHAFAGVIFAMFGAYLPQKICKQKTPLALDVFCAFFFSVAIAALWELIEFSMDSFFGTDMQKDTLLHALRPSYLFSELLGYPVGILGELNDVHIFIEKTSMKGYVDLGLIDSMKDIFIETMGATFYTILYALGRGKHFTFTPISSFSEAKTQPKDYPKEEFVVECSQ